jgi:HAD superfamily hydrolase (TIGR01509 family)
MVKAVLFDMDGTIVHTLTIWDTILGNIVGHSNIQEFRNFRETIPGKGMEQTCKALRSFLNVKMSDEKIINWHEYEATIAIENTSIEFVEGFIDFHKELKKKSLVGLVTNAPNYALNVFKKKLALPNMFDSHIYNSCQVGGLMKPNSALLTYALNKMCIFPYECSIFEDTVRGITAAKAIGIKTVIGINSHNNKKELGEADYIIDNYNDKDHILSIL